MTSNCASNNAKDGQKWNTNDTSNDKNSVIAPAIAFYPPYHTSNDHQQNNDQSRLAQLRHTITGPICTTNDRGITGILVPCVNIISFVITMDNGQEADSKIQYASRRVGMPPMFLMKTTRDLIRLLLLLLATMLHRSSIQSLDYK
jgi:hypothetical protein